MYTHMFERQSAEYRVFLPGGRVGIFQSTATENAPFYWRDSLGDESALVFGTPAEALEDYRYEHFGFELKEID